MVMGIGAFERPEHEKSIANKAKEQAYLPPHSMEELYAEQSGSAYEPYIMEVACGPMGWIVDLTCKDSSPRMRSADHGSWMIEYARSLVWAYGIADAREAIETMLQRCRMGFLPASFDRVNLS